MKKSESKFQVTLHVKMAIPDSQKYSLNLYLTNNVEDNVVSRGLKVFFFLKIPICFPAVEMHF